MVICMRNKYTYYKDVEISITPKEWANFTVPEGISVLWDRYNFRKNSVVGRFYVSEAHLLPSQRKTEEHLNRFLESLGEYVITENATNERLKDQKWGQRSITYMNHPFLKDMPKNIDVHEVNTEGKTSLEEGKHYDAKKKATKEELKDINQSIITETRIDPQLKKYMDERFKLKQNETEIYTAVLEEVG